MSNQTSFRDAVNVTQCFHCHVAPELKTESANGFHQVWLECPRCHCRSRKCNLNKFGPKVAALRLSKSWNENHGS